MRNISCSVLSHLLFTAYLWSLPSGPELTHLSNHQTGQKPQRVVFVVIAVLFMLLVDSCSPDLKLISLIITSS